MSDCIEPDNPEILLGLAFTSPDLAAHQVRQACPSLSLAVGRDTVSDQPSHTTHTLKDKLINLCTQPGLVGLEAARMFDVTTFLSLPYILDRLVTVHMETRGTTCPLQPRGALSIPGSDVEDEREKIENLSEDIKEPGL